MKLFVSRLALRHRKTHCNLSRSWSNPCNRRLPLNSPSFVLNDVTPSLQKKLPNLLVVPSASRTPLTLNRRACCLLRRDDLKLQVCGNLAMRGTFPGIATEWHWILQISNPLRMSIPSQQRRPFPIARNLSLLLLQPTKSTKRGSSCQKRPLSLRGSALNGKPPQLVQPSVHPSTSQGNSPLRSNCLPGIFDSAIFLLVSSSKLPRWESSPLRCSMLIHPCALAVSAAVNTAPSGSIAIKSPPSNRPSILEIASPWTSSNPLLLDSLPKTKAD